VNKDLSVFKTETEFTLKPLVFDLVSNFLCELGLPVCLEKSPVDAVLLYIPLYRLLNSNCTVVSKRLGRNDKGLFTLLVGIPGYDMRLVRVAAVQMCGQ